MNDYSDTQIEREIQDKGLVAPRITPEFIESKIVNELYHQFPGTTVTVCLLILKNGFSVTGESAAVSMDNFDKDIGEKVARQHARDQMWRLLGYQLKEDIYRHGNPGTPEEHVDANSKRPR